MVQRVAHPQLDTARVERPHICHTVLCRGDQGCANPRVDWLGFARLDSHLWGPPGGEKKLLR